MSSACTRLLKIVKPRHTAPVTTAKTRIPQINHPVKELLSIVDIDEFATKFKQIIIESPQFRNRTNIYEYAIARLAHANRHSVIEDILETHKSFDDITRKGFAVRIMFLYGKAGMFDHARKLFDEMPQLKCERTIMSFNALLSAGVKSKRFNEVCQIFREYPSKLSLSLDVISYNTVIHALCEMDSLTEAVAMFDELKNNGLQPSVITFNTLLDAFYRKKGFLGGEWLWAMMEEDNVRRDIQSYNLTLEALVNQGELSTAVILFDLLATEGVKPNVITFNIFVKGYCDQGNVDEGIKWYKALLESENVPNRKTFSTLVPELCRFGEHELAFDLTKKMFKRQFVVDEAMLQLVVNELVKKSMVKEAEELVMLGKTNNFVQYNLTLYPEQVTATGAEQNE